MLFDTENDMRPSVTMTQHDCSCRVAWRTPSCTCKLSQIWAANSGQTGRQQMDCDRIGLLYSYGCINTIARFRYNCDIIIYIINTHVFLYNKIDSWTDGWMDRLTDR